MKQLTIALLLVSLLGLGMTLQGCTEDEVTTVTVTLNGSMD